MTSFFRAATLAAFGVLLGFGVFASQHALADEPHDGLGFSIGVRGVAGCNTRASDVACTLPSGQTFIAEVALDSLPDDIPSYGGFDLYIEHAGVTPSDDANSDDWPDCGFPVSFPGDGFIALGCAIGVPPAGPSSYVGPIGSVTFTCSQSGSISLVHGAGDKTDLIESVGEGPDGTSSSVTHAEGADESETITIECGQVPAETPGIVTGGTPGEPGPTPGSRDGTPPSSNATPADPNVTLEPTARAQATFAAADSATATAEADDGGPPGSNGEDDDDDSNMWIWIVIIAAAVAAVVIAAGGYWYMRSRGGGTGGGPTSRSGVTSGGPPTSGAGSAGATPSSGGGSRRHRVVDTT